MYWATFWAIFSPTHLVTLIPNNDGVSFSSSISTKRGFKILPEEYKK
jgi:hypothetical protein